MIDELSTVTKNEKLADRLYEMHLRSPKIAKAVRPGQFIHLELPSLQANILRRPFSVYDVDVDEGIVDVLYQDVGVGTDDMTEWPIGYEASMLGPIGMGWSAPLDVKRAILVGGGVGAAPLLMLYRRLVERGVDVDAVIGAATKDALVCKDRYESIGDGVPLFTTDDGTFGIHGFTTAGVEHLLGEHSGEYDYAAICGPEPMIKAVSSITVAANIPTQVSLERKMACGLGACLSCVCDTNSGKKRVCVDGPVFDVEELGWF